MKNLVAIIPARKIDAIIENKNVLPIGQTNLLTNKIRQLKKVPAIKSIIVTSESQDFLDIAKSEGVITNLRPLKYASLDSSFGDFVSYISSQVDGEHILWAPPTSPLLDNYDIIKIIKKYEEAILDGYDSIITVSEVRRHLLDNNGPLNFRFQKSTRNLNKLPLLFEFTNGLTIAPKNSMIKWQYNWGILPYKYIISENKSIDICNEIDYQLAKLLFNLKKLN